jgi:VanZ family protein
MNLSRVWWTLGLLLVVAAAVVCLIPMREMPRAFDVNDKVSHLIGHGALALYFAGLVPLRSWWKILVLLVLFGISIEFAQYYMRVGRHGDARDVLANGIGAVLGLVLARCGLARWPEVAAWVLGRRAVQ